MRLPAAAINPLFGHDTQLSRLDNRHPAKGPITTTQVRHWAHTAASITIRPVIDLAEHINTTAYEVPDRLAEQTDLRDHTCVFPWCTRPARACESDHVIPHQHGGPTSTDNLAPLCKRHHRLKTHTTWRYTMIEPGTYLWSAPHGGTYLRDHTGTTET